MEIDQLNLTANKIESSLGKYAEYLNSVINGKYTLTEKEIKLLDLPNGQSKSRLNQVRNKLRSYSHTRDEMASFDFDANGRTDDSEKDIDFLKNIVSKPFNKGASSRLSIFRKTEGERPEWLKGAGEKIVADYVFKTTGGFFLSSSKSGVDVKIHDQDGKLMTRIWGDPHVYEYAEDGSKMTGQWHYSDDSTFILPDGTKIWTNSVGNEKVKVNRGLYISDGADLYHFGREYGEGRETEALDDDTNAAQEFDLRKLDISLEEWDTNNSDAHQSGLRNGVYALDEKTREWAKLNKETNKFEDLNSESWGNYLKRDDKALHTNDEVTLTRSQLVASLDGEQIRQFNSLHNNISEKHLFKVEDLFLENRSRFTESRLSRIVNLSKFDEALSSDFSKVLNEDSSARETEFLDLLSAKDLNFFSHDQSNDNVKKYLFESFFRTVVLDESLEVMSAEEKLRAEFVLRAFDLSIEENEPFAIYANGLKSESLDSEMDMANFAKRMTVLEKVKFSGLISEDAEKKETFLTAVAGKFFDVDELEAEEAFARLGNEEKAYIHLLERFIDLNIDEKHSYWEAFDYMGETLLSGESANAYIFGKFTEDETKTEYGARSSVNRKNTELHGSANENVELIKIMMGDLSVKFEDFQSNSVLIGSLRNEGDADTIAANKLILSSLYKMRIKGLEAKQEALEAAINSARGSNSLVAKFGAKKKFTKLREVKLELSKFEKAIKALDEE